MMPLQEFNYFSFSLLRIQTVLEMLTSKLEAVDTQLSSLASSPKPPAAASGPPPAGAESTTPKQGTIPITEGASDEEHNKAYLKTLDVEQVSRC